MNEEIMLKTMPGYIGSRIRWLNILKYLPKGAGNLLDCGAEGGIYKELVQYKGYDYSGIDIEPQNESILKMDVTNLDFPPERFPVILAIDVLEHVKDDFKAVNEMYRVLQKDGLLIVHVPNKEQHHILFDEIEDQESHVRKGYSITELKELFMAFRDVQIIPTFDYWESLSWDLYNCMNKGITIDLSKIYVDKDKKFQHYGFLIRCIK